MTIPAYRFAPSPNGELHLGHAYSALLNERLAEEAGGRFLIRIEDIDRLRCKPEFAAKALADLAWLGLRWETPVRFQSEHLADYATQQKRLSDRGLLYPCFCSRKNLAVRSIGQPLDPEGQPLYDGVCRTLPAGIVHRWIGDRRDHVIRIDMAVAIAMAGNGPRLDPAPWGDVVFVRKDIGTSYHVAVVTDDALQGITHVVRGRDLAAATSIHQLLQKLLGLPTPDYHHHRLLTDDDGKKLSKSSGSKSLRALRGEGVTPADIRRALGFA